MTRSGRWPRLLLGAAILLVALVPLLTPNTYIQNMLILTFVLAIIASGWNVMAGFTGYISLGHAAFIGVGAYTGGILASRWEVSPLLVAPLGGVAAALVALLLGFTTRRTRGAAFVIVQNAEHRPCRSRGVATTAAPRTGARRLRTMPSLVITAVFLAAGSRRG